MSSGTPHSVSIRTARTGWRRPRAVRGLRELRGSDEYTARKIYDELRHAVTTFFFKEYSHRDDLSRSIDDALDSATRLIVACTSLDNIARDRCSYEWKGFCREWGSNLKASNAVIIPFVASDINPEDLSLVVLNVLDDEGWKEFSAMAASISSYHSDPRASIRTCWNSQRGYPLSCVGLHLRIRAVERHNTSCLLGSA